MNETVKTDVLSVIAEARRAVESHDVSLLKELSDHTLHTTTIFQDEVSINTAILAYALYKGLLQDHLTPGRILPVLKELEDALIAEDDDALQRAFRKAFHMLKRDMRESILEVMRHASIQKARKVYEHGVSLAHAARLMNVSLWEVVGYIGLTPVHDVETGRDILQRVRFAGRALRSGKLVFDAGPIIALTLTGLLDEVARVAERSGVQYRVPRPVERELIDHPLETRKYAFEAYRVIQYFERGIFRLESSHRLRRQAVSLLNLANSLFKAHGEWLRIVSLAEIAVLVHALEHDAIAVIDERSARMLVEQPRHLAEWMSRKLHTRVTLDSDHLRVWKNALRGLRIVRSVDLVFSLALEGYLEHYVPHHDLLIKRGMQHAHAFSQRHVVESALWGLKLNGCSVGRGEIERAVAYYAKRRMGGVGRV